MVDWKKVAIAGVGGAAIGYLSFYVGEENKTRAFEAPQGMIPPIPPFTVAIFSRALGFGLTSAFITGLIT